MTIKAWIALHLEKFNLVKKGDYISLGRKASHLSKVLHKDIKHISDEEFRDVGCYSVDILKLL